MTEPKLYQDGNVVPYVEGTVLNVKIRPTIDEYADGSADEPVDRKEILIELAGYSRLYIADWVDGWKDSNGEPVNVADLAGSLSGSKVRLYVNKDITPVHVDGVHIFNPDGKDFSAAEPTYNFE